MKTKFFLAVLIGLLFTCQIVQARRQTMKEHTDNWLKNTPSATEDSSGMIGDEIPEDDPGVPVGDALWIVLGLGLIYGVYLFKDKRVNNA
jgi:hypothetical protein